MQKVILSIAVAAVVAAIGLVGSPAEAQVMPPVLLKLEQAGKNLKSLQAGISQQKQDRVLGVKENSTGSLLYKAGAAGTERVLLTYTSPIPETVSVVGEKVTIYQPKLNQLFVTSRKAGVNKNRSLGFLGLAYSDAAQQLRDKYTITLLGEDMVNGQGNCHGGVLATLADSAFAFACNTYDEVTVAAGFDIVFVAPARLGDQLTATALERARFGRSGLYDVSITRADGELVAEFRGRSRSLGRPLLGPGEPSAGA